MKKFLAALALLLAPTFASAAVISSIEVKGANGGFNPSFSGITISGTIFGGGNSCQAAQYTASIKKTLVDGVVTFKPVLKRKASTVMCPMYIEPGFLGPKFSQTFVMEGALLDTAVVENVNELGNTVTIESLLNGEVAPDTSCQNIERICPMNFDPQTCTYGNYSAQGSNGCVAAGRIQSLVCAAEGKYDHSLVSCARVGSAE